MKFRSLSQLKRNGLYLKRESIIIKSYLTAKICVFDLSLKILVKTTDMNHSLDYIKKFGILLRYCIQKHITRD